MRGVVVGIALAPLKRMATKSEQYKASAQRDAALKKTTKKKPGRAKPRAKPKTAKTTTAHGTRATAKKAAYALEHAEGGKRPSRKSTRASAHHERLDSALALRQEGRAGSADSRFRRAKAKASRVRGS